MKTLLQNSLDRIDAAGLWLGLLSLRLLLGWDYFESGLEKFHGENWFAEIADKFPFPFNVVSVDISWQLSTWFELIGAVALVIGLGTRFFAASLTVLTVVAIAAAHWPESWATLGELAQGYVLTDQGHGNFKLPTLFLGMLLPLMLLGPGRLSLDAFIRSRLAAPDDHHVGHPTATSSGAVYKKRFCLGKKLRRMAFVDNLPRQSGQQVIRRAGGLSALLIDELAHRTEMLDQQPTERHMLRLRQECASGRRGRRTLGGCPGGRALGRSRLGGWRRLPSAIQKPMNQLISAETKRSRNNG
jgi:putative oxidoreductase